MIFVCLFVLFHVLLIRISKYLNEIQWFKVVLLSLYYSHGLKNFKKLAIIDLYLLVLLLFETGESFY